ncbi:thiopurine S-methyltransferase [Alkalimarinus sediminis]|uniref:Thiopurine S-methyltransferase n=1 Tax=Alkalimarinus sediminis TaxID=1632866 RepID=A0A9E8HGF6_9ALTE|nr:thiopurine S-methyltransferase [Alkalimarinus sediminis]UZW73757.1 thiopurine S-methyltransferase [Alkalimarinus sediminis]
MDASFWHQRWELGEIAFHEGEANSLLVKHFGLLNLAKGSRVFVPLCGKTQDIPWLLTQGYEVVGVELSEIAVKELFASLGIVPAISNVGSLIHYQGRNIDIFVGDIFDVTTGLIQPVDAIYDRAALVALPEDMRNQYTAHLINITMAAPQLIICFEYDQSVMPGPPFSVNAEEVMRHYESAYSWSLVESREVAGGLKGKADASEMVWVLTN